MEKCREAMDADAADSGERGGRRREGPDEEEEILLRHIAHTL
jgi:hypothetical protein